MTGSPENITMLSIARPDSKQSDSGEDRLIDLVAIMVHDLQGPFVSMKTLLKLLTKGSFNVQNKAHADLLTSSITALDRAESIIFDLIDIAKTNKSGIPVDLGFYDLTEIVDNSILMLKASAFEYGINIKTNLQADIKVQADKDLLLRVLDNLIFNALKHGPKGSNVEIQSVIEDDRAVVSVTDEGGGLADLDPDELFDKYKQLDLRKSGKYKGVGLGLYFCRLAIEAMHGRIWIDQNVKGGAKFIFSLVKDRRKG